MFRIAFAVFFLVSGASCSTCKHANSRELPPSTSATNLNKATTTNEMKEVILNGKVVKFTPKPSKNIGDLMNDKPGTKQVKTKKSK